MRLGAVTYNLLKDWDIETIIKNLTANGFEAVELRTTHKHGVEPSIGAAERAQVRSRFANSKVRLLAYGTTCEFHSPNLEERRRQVAIGKQFVDLAHDTGAWGVKVRPNGFPQELSREATVGNIAASLRELGDYAQGKGIEIWLEVHGRETQEPNWCAAIMRATRHKDVGLCWNSNPTDVVNGSVKQSFELLRPWIKSVHITDLTNSYPWRELFGLLRAAKYDRYTLCEYGQESKEPEVLLRWYAALWRELVRP